MTAIKLMNRQTQELCDHITSIVKRIEEYVGEEAQFSSQDVLINNSESVLQAHQKLSYILGILSDIEEKYLQEEQP